MRNAILRFAPILLCMCLLAACASPNANPTGESGAGGATPSSDAAKGTDEGGVFGTDDLNLTWYVNYDWFTATPWADKLLGEQWIRDNKKVTIEFQDAGGAAKQRFATMLVDGVYPDLITVDRGQDLDKLIASSAIIPLDAYLEGSNLTKWLSEGTINMLKAADGHLYVYPNWAIGEGRNNGNAGWFINREIYEEMGSPKLETFEDLYAYLTQVKQAHPDMIPLEGYADLGLGATVFCGMDENLKKDYYDYGVPVDGKLTSVYRSDYFRETMLFLNKLYRENLLTQDIFTQNNDQAQEKVISGRTAVMCDGDAANRAEKARPQFMAANPGNDFVFIEPIHKAGKDVSKIYVETSKRLGWNVATISKDNKNPKQTFDFLDWMFGEEGQRIASLGPPDMYFESGDYTEEGYPKNIKDAYYALTEDELANIGCANWVGNTSFVDGLGEYMIKLPKGTKNWTKIQQTTMIWNHSHDATEFSYMEPDPATEVGVMYQTIKELRKEALATIVMSDSEQACLDNLELYAKLMEDAGLSQVLDYQNEVYAKNLQMLGAK